ncbi:hypothetical protein GCM10010172_57120 [Paractinoplanes ferrugineus]|uniref:Uncharacterized protein n=1 Tax=Paractinoplanes ferrugineus TaxID=113564 RepID=A0A919MCJ5_9ACTN|nr:hypothetical protein [Actinoplanes ferrugineus]GIE10818.1 hypothetical protein Afe05nite_26580 [Actinoplanes ferrugineus]
MRSTAVRALVELATSADCRDRADAGRALASFAEMPEARAALARVVVDPEDTFVTLVTAEALLRRSDAKGLSLVAAALAETDDQQHAQIQESVSRVFLLYASERDAALALCASLPDGALLAALLSEIEPILYPA